MTSAFKGFPKETIQFFNALEANNNKTWFNAHKYVVNEVSRIF